MTAPFFVAIELHVFLGAGTGSTQRGAPFEAPGPAALAAARRRGLRTAVCAHDRAYYGSRYDDLVDEWVVCQTRDAVDVARAVAALPGSIAAVHSFVDTFVGTAAAVNRALGLKGADPSAPGLVRDKSRARRALADAGLEAVRFGTVVIGRDELRSPIGYPCIAKPVDGAASWDVRLVHDDQDVAELAEQHLGRHYGRGVTQRGELLFEEYLAGPLWSVEGWVSDGHTEVFGWTDREQAEPPDFAELSFGFGTEPPVDGAHTWAVQTLEALGYDHGPFHLEAILTPGGLRLLELNPRLVGCGAHPSISSVLGHDVVDHVVGRLLGEGPASFTPDGAATTRLLVSGATGRVRRVTGLDDAAAGAGFVSAVVSVGEGDAVDASLSSNAAHIGFVTVRGKDREEANTRARLLAHHVRVDIDEHVGAVG